MEANETKPGCEGFLECPGCGGPVYYKMPLKGEFLCCTWRCNDWARERGPLPGRQWPSTLEATAAALLPKGA